VDFLRQRRLWNGRFEEGLAVCLSNRGVCEANRECLLPIRIMV
jgi:hypothetical protein